MTEPEFKKSLDERLVALAKRAGKSEDDVRDALDDLHSESGNPWRYFFAALDATRGKLLGEAMRERGAHHWLLYFADGKDAGFVEPILDDENDDDDDESPRIRIESYPEEARECLSQGNFVGGYDADVVALWSRDGGTALCHAHPEGFWILGSSPGEFVDDFIAAVS